MYVHTIFVRMYVLYVDESFGGKQFITKWGGLVLRVDVHMYAYVFVCRSIARALMTNRLRYKIKQ